MTIFNKPIYFCSECKKIVEALDDLLFIDEHSHKGFCKEECIEDFYFPLIKHFEIMESSLRHKHGLEAELAQSTLINADMIDRALKSPSEIYRQKNELNEAFYYFIKHFEETSVVVISSVYRKEASFVFLATTTKSQMFLAEFRFGELLHVGDFSEEEDNRLSVEEFDEEDSAGSDHDPEGDEDMIFIQLLESKKSNLLAEILMNIKEDDIPFEDYSGYESCFQETLDSPDEVFEKKDKEGDMVFTYIKTFRRGDETFYYIVICLKRMAESETVNVYPILAMPTTDMKMCQEFRGGTRLSGPLKN